MVRSGPPAEPSQAEAFVGAEAEAEAEDAEAEASAEAGAEAGAEASAQLGACAPARAHADRTMYVADLAPTGGLCSGPRARRQDHVSGRD